MFQEKKLSKNEELNQVMNMMLDPSYTSHNNGSLYYEYGKYKWGSKSIATTLFRRGLAEIDTDDYSKFDQERSNLYFLKPTQKLKDLYNKK